MSIRRLFAVLMAIAVLLGPVLTHGSAAAAAIPDHHAQMMASGHCEAPLSELPGEDTTGAMTCCIALCSAVPAAPPAPLSEAPLERAPLLSAVSTAHVSYLAEIATPPPRRA